MIGINCTESDRVYTWADTQPVSKCVLPASILRKMVERDNAWNEVSHIADAHEACGDMVEQLSAAVSAAKELDDCVRAMIDEYHQHPEIYDAEDYARDTAQMRNGAA